MSNDFATVASDFVITGSKYRFDESSGPPPLVLPNTPGGVYADWAYTGDGDKWGGERKTSEETRQDSSVEETLFFYPIIGALKQLADDIHDN